MKKLLGGLTISTNLRSQGQIYSPTFWFRGDDALPSLWYERSLDINKSLAVSGASCTRTIDNPLGTEDLSITFTGSSSYFCPDNSKYDVTTEDFAFLTVVYLANPAGLARTIFSKEFYTIDSYGYSLTYNADETLSFYYNQESFTSINITSSLTVSPGWHMISIFGDNDESVSGNGLQMWLDEGTLLAESKLDGYNATNPSFFELGVLGGGGTNVFNGQIAMVAGWIDSNIWPGGSTNPHFWEQIHRKWFQLWTEGL